MHCNNSQRDMQAAEKCYKIRMADNIQYSSYDLLTGKGGHFS